MSTAPFSALPQPRQEYYLSVSAVHRLYIACYGNPDGIPVLFLHGGPGAGTHPAQSHYCDLSHYYYILFDQRGCGRSTPMAELTDNTTAHLIQDIEAIRQHLMITQWVLLASSWGSTLALHYHFHYHHRVKAIVLRSPFLSRKADIEWVYHPNGAATLFPTTWQKTIQPWLTDDCRPITGQLLQALKQADRPQQKQIVQALLTWSLTLSHPEYKQTHPIDIFPKHYAQCLIQLHYATHQAFLKPATMMSILSECHTLPVWLIHGEKDKLCPIANTYQLHHALPHSQLITVPNSGHSGQDPAMVKQVYFAMQHLASQLEKAR